MQNQIAPYLGSTPLLNFMTASWASAMASSAALLWGLYMGTLSVRSGTTTAGELGQAVVYVILLASAFAVFYNVLLFGVDAQAAAILVMAGLLFYRHKQNIANLMAGKESKIGQKS